ncbi:MAG: hypothetical protein K0R65_2744 [Crocinitomicaceae bacterium]|jgi:hypothetical protein|nr:hypothetical protein [Crocinitomicaceae bacterium]
MKRIISENQSVKIAALFMVFVFLLNDCISFASNLNLIRDWNQKALNKGHFLPLESHLKTEGQDKRQQHNNETENKAFLSVLNKMAASNPTSGESSGFSIGSTDGMVDKFTGDFSYSIPLLDVDGYPLTLSYNSNVGMMSEASWVGLGWDLNVGSISREMRGIPDEFNGTQQIARTFNQINGDDAETNGEKYGSYLGYSYSYPEDNEFFFPGLEITTLFGKYNSPYVGLGKTMDISVKAHYSMGDEDDKMNIAPMFNFGYSRDTKNGIGKSYNFGLHGGAQLKENVPGGGVSFGSSFNSRKGTTDKSFGLSIGNANKYADATLSATSSLTFGTATSIPRAMFDLHTNGHMTSLDLYTAFQALGGKLTIGALLDFYNSNSALVFNDVNNQRIFQPAYGYLHSGKRKFHEQDGKYPVMDYERTRDFEFSENMKNLSFSTQTFDIFNVNASGMGGTFRAGRTDFGTYYDPQTENIHNAASGFLGDLDAASAGLRQSTTGTFIELSYSAGSIKGKLESDNWKFGAENLIEFEDQLPSPYFDNTTYFKQVGEQTPNDLAVYQIMNANQPEFFEVDKTNHEIVLTSNLTQTGIPLTNNLNQLTQRPVRATQFLPKLVEEYGTTDVFYSYNYDGSAKDPIHREDNTLRVANHISSIDVVSTDGTHYSYGIPVYSLENSEVAFATDASTENYYGLSSFEPADNSILNDEGRDHYYDRTTMPAYPTAFLLTEMKSSDYVDRTNDGPSLDDVGNYYHFNYHQEYSLADPYTWRFPISLDNNTSAFLSKGLQGTELDEMANYTIGKKEIWYLHSVETKNYIVEIHLNDPSVANRFDGFGAIEKGPIDSHLALRRIEKIVLYNRNEKLTNPNAVPLQTIMFEYDYSLCKRTPSNIYTNSTQYSKSGKLTLKAVRIYTGNSLENALKSYDFTYSNFNPDFDYRYIDGWGNIKKDNLTAMKNEFYPYAVQDEIIANENATAWKLVKIENPQGGLMEIVYEADRYGYVQNKRAMKHLKVDRMTNLLEFFHIQDQASWNGHSNTYETFNRTGFDRDGVESYLDNLGYDEDEIDDIADLLFKHKERSFFYGKFEKIEEDIFPNNVIIFPLEDMLSNVSETEANEIVKQKYFMQDNEQIKELYFKMHVNVKQDVEDLVPTFATIAQPCNGVFHSYLDVNENLLPFGVMPPDAGGNYRFGYVVLDLAVSGSKEEGSGQDDGGIALHPLQKAALEFARTNLVDKVYGACVDCEGDLTVDKGAIFGADIYKRMIRDAQYAPDFDPERSLLRLYDADMVKFGGNARVKQIVYKDNWDAISEEDYLSSYQWNYVYEQEDPRTFGVAAFEPKQISDENPFYMWDSYQNFNDKFPDETRFNPTPISDALFPNPIVGYEEVRVFFENNNEKGYSKSKFHTYKELAYATKERSSHLQETYLPDNNRLTGKGVDLYGFSQGYFVQTNDFHGKPCETAVYDKNDNLQSRSRYNYYGMGEKVKTLDREGGLAQENVAVEFDMHNDSRFVMDENRVFSAGIEMALRITPTIAFPLFKPKVSINSREKGFYSNTLIKHINYSAVVKSIETETLGSINTAENMVYDRFSGSVIVSSLKDEFNDKLFSVNYPSHWYYDELKELTDMQGRSGSVNLSATGSFSQVNHVLTPGDIIRIGSSLYRVSKQIFDTDNNSFFLIKEDGGQASFTAGSHNYTLVHCNRDNRLGETMQNVTTKVNPINGTSFNFPTSEIISAGCLTYRDKLNLRCGLPCERGNNNEVEPNSTINPYQYGVRGDLVIDGQYAWQSERLQDQHAHGIRFDGTYTEFKPFYSLGTGNKWFKLTQGAHPGFLLGEGTQKWRKLGEVTLFDPYGNPLESRDQVDVFSSVLYGYNSTFNLVPVASAINARMQDIAFDGFEDYLYYLEDCMASKGHFDFKDQIGTEFGVKLEKTERHSGLNSLKINSGKTAIVTRTLTEGRDCVTFDANLENDDRLKEKVFEVESCDCIRSFDPTPGTYIVGLWVKKDENNVDAGVSIKLSGDGMTTLTHEFMPAGPIIEGWQRVEGEFEIPVEAEEIKVVLFNNTPVPAYFDDVRIHPFLAGMTTVVYDPKSLLPMATHDGYNFTTFYNYDENLQQSRVKVETVEGIKTIIESENGGKIKYEGQ